MSLTPRPPPTATGLLSKRPFLHLLVFAADKRLSGTIEFVTPSGGTSQVVFSAGAPVKVKTSEPVAYLGRVLLEQGALTDDSLNRSLALFAKERGLHGALLLRHGMITKSALESGLREQLRRKLHAHGALPGETTFDFYDQWDGLRDYGGVETVAVDPWAVVLTLAREYPPEEHVAATLEKVSQAALRLSPSHELARLVLSSSELAVVDLMRMRAIPLSEVIRNTQATERTTRLLIYALLVTRQLEVVTREKASVPPPPMPPPPPQRFSTPPPARAVPRPASVPPPPSAPEAPGALRGASAEPPSDEVEARKALIRDRAARIDQEDYFTMLGIPSDASIDEARKAYLGLAKLWHPDRIPESLASVRTECAKVFSRLSEAHLTLGDATARGRYISLMKDGSATPEAMDTVSTVLEAAMNFQKAEVCFKRNDLLRAEELCRLAKNADPKQADYLALLTWLEAMKPEGQPPEATKHAIGKLTDAIALNPKCERAYFYRGQLHKRIGNKASAIRDFREVTELNPRNIDAAREVRLFAKRASTPPPPEVKPSTPPPRPSQVPPKRTSDPPGSKPGPGLIGRLFKK